MFERPKGSGIWWIDYVGPDHREHVERGGTKTEARALLARRKTEIADSRWRAPYGHGIHARIRSSEPADGSRTTLGAFARAWLKERAPHLTPTVREDYERLLRFHLFKDSLAHKSLAEIHDGDIAGLINRLSEKRTRGGRSLSARRINMVIGRLRTMFATARRRKLMAEDPMPYVANLREPKPEVEPFDLGEARRQIDAARGWTRAFLTVLVFTGMRPNEVLALPWDACDFEHDVIRVRRTVNRRQAFGLAKDATTLEMLFRVYSRWMERPESRALARLDAAFRAESGRDSGQDSGLKSTQFQ